MTDKPERVEGPDQNDPVYRLLDKTADRLAEKVPNAFAVFIAVYHFDEQGRMRARSMSSGRSFVDGAVSEYIGATFQDAHTAMSDKIAARLQRMVDGKPEVQ